MRWLTFVTGLLALGVVASPAVAQSHFTDCLSKTETNATLLIPSDAELQWGSEAPAPGDEIAVFSPDGQCSGVEVWTGESIAVAVWSGATPPTSTAGSRPASGLQSGDSLQFRVWDASTAREYAPRRYQVTHRFSDTKPFYTTTDRFVPDGIYVLTMLRFDSVQAERRDSERP